MLFPRVAAIWFIFIIAESLNGAIRELWLVPALGDIHAHQVSFLTGSILILTIATLFIHWLHASCLTQLIQVGLYWLVLTVGFEIALGHFALGYSWSRIAVDYDVRQGGLMPFGLALLTAAPVIAAKLRGVLPNAGSQPILNGSNVDK